jgi:endonuclease/exonuclease/phosphatase family metal-dependent hydrolase
MIKEFTILNWNIGGAKYLQEEKDKREKTREELNSELNNLIKRYKKPSVITLQEIVRYGASNQNVEEIIDPIEHYKYCSFPLIDSDRLSSKAKWNKIKRLGGWPPETFFAQGNAMIFRDDMPHFPVWDLATSSMHRHDEERHFIEQVNLENGLYFGDRNTEPRAALVAHFILNPGGENTMPLDIFVVNLHLTTLMLEREGIPEIDIKATQIRLNQLNVIFCGIVSRYNTWKRQKFPERGEPRKTWENGETDKRHEPVWILAGDFNFTQESEEYETIQRMNFIDVVPNKGGGTKAKGADNPPTLTVDYIFAGPKFISLDPLITTDGIKNNTVDHTVIGSDHYPMYAKIPIAIPEEK